MGNSHFTCKSLPRITRELLAVNWLPAWCFFLYLSHFLLLVNKEGKKCQFLLGAVIEESSLNPSRLHCSVSPSPGAAQSASDVSLATPHSHTESHSSGSGKDIL